MTLEEKTATDLEIARQLARDGIPIFVAPPSDDPKDTSGFRLPSGWQQTVPDPAVLDRWQPGWAVCLVTGHGLDLVDLDIYANPDAGKLIEGLVPFRYGAAATASGGVHIFVRSIGVASKNALMPGIDIKSGTPEGKGRGFAFIAPTVKKSKVNGQPATYSWIMPPDAAAARSATGDTSGQPLAEMVTASRKRSQAPAANGSVPGSEVTVDAFLAQNQPGPWKNIKATLEAGRNDGVMRLACSLRQKGGWSLEAALKYMYEHVWPVIDQGQGGHEFPAEEFESIIGHAWRAYPDGAEEALRQAEENQQAARDAAVLRPPGSVVELTDAFLVRQVRTWVLNDFRTGTPRLRWARGLGWLLWTGLVWLPVDDGYIRNQIREFFALWYRESIRIVHEESLDAAILGKMTGLLSKARIAAVADLAHGFHDDEDPLARNCKHGLLTLRCAHCSVMLDPAGFDAHPDLLNTPGGIVDLRTGDVRPHDSALLFTRISSGSYKPGYRHADWDKALEALPEAERAWFKQRIGQGITGHPPGDGIMVVLQGHGENGKTACTTDGPVRALGDYGATASHKLITAATGSRGEHSTEIADLRGKRLLVGEELAEGRSIDVTALKRIQDVGKITARYVHRDNITFDASHTLLVTTNYIPVINETDHGTWRRLALLKFPYTFRKSAELCTRKADRIGDAGLKQRIKYNADGQHDAIVTWAVEGAIDWYKRSYADAPPTKRVVRDTQEWRATADGILGFWQTRLTADSAACILAEEMRDQFNTYWTENGHSPWSKETFGPRFGGHEETTRNGVENKVLRRPEGLVRWPVPGTIQRSIPEKSQRHYWVGVRPKTQEDEGFEPDCDEGDDLDVKSSDRFSYRSFTPESSHSSHPPEASPQSDEVDEPSGSQDRAQPVVVPESPPDPGSPLDPESPTVTKKPEKPAKPKAPRPDPELEGPIHELPAIVARNPEGGLPLVLPCTLEQAAQLCEPYLDALCVDVEHSGYPPGHRDYELRLVQLGGEQVAAVFDPAVAEHRAVIADLVNRARKLHAHSATADLVPLAHAGIADPGMLWAKMEDSVLIAKLGDPGLAGSDENELKRLSAGLLGDYAVSPDAEKAKNELFKSGRWLVKADALTPRERSGWAMVRKNCTTFARYAGSDVLDLAAVVRVLPRPDEAVLARERHFQAMCARVAHHGFRLDHDHIRAKITEHEQALAAAQKRVAELCPAITNPSSTKEVPEALAALGVPLGVTPGGKASAAKTELEILSKDPAYEHHELLTQILEYRHHVTTLGLLLRPLDVLCEHGDGRMRPTVYTINADTGRTSCVRPNGQQFSRQGGIRACVVADPGMTGISADFSGVEIRVAAALSGDMNLLAAELDGQDHETCADHRHGLHWMAAKMAWGEGATKENRYAAKRIIFSKLFGGSPKAGSRQTGVPYEAAQAVHRAFEQIAPGYAEWDRRMRAYADAGNRAFPAYSGRIIWLPRGRSHAAGNYAIQGTAREALVDGTLAWDRTPWGHLPLLPIHDELLTMYIPEAEALEALEALKACMRNQRFFETFGVPIEAAADEPFRAWPDSS